MVTGWLILLRRLTSSPIPSPPSGYFQRRWTTSSLLFRSPLSHPRTFLCFVRGARVVTLPHCAQRAPQAPMSCLLVCCGSALGNWRFRSASSPGQSYAA
eukprot:4724775-Alexandrium_andersonii.AAC.1